MRPPRRRRDQPPASSGRADSPDAPGLAPAAPSGGPATRAGPSRRRTSRGPRVRGVLRDNGRVGPDPAVAAVRLAVRRTLASVEAGDLVLVACSGGADSLALAGALAFEAARSGHRAGGVTIDHGLQEGSAERAEGVVATMAGLGLDPAEARTVAVGSDGGMEAAARTARYNALDESVVRHRAGAVLLGHTLDDQAETVLLGL